MKNAKKILSLVLAVLMLLSVVPYVAALDNNGKQIVASKSCDTCSFKWTFYDDFTLVFDGDENVAKDYHPRSFFDGTEKAEKIVIEENVKLSRIDIINYWPSYYYCEEFQVSNNPYYTAIDGVLFSKDKTILYKYPLGNERSKYVIPSLVETVFVASFIERSKENMPKTALEELVVPSSVIEFGSYAFLSSSLKKVVFEDGERTLFIGDATFYNAENLNVIVLPSSRLYSVVSTSFLDTAYYNDESNWDNGVLYLDDIILDVNSYEISSEYSIKDGTKIIADLATFACISYNGDGWVKVTVPESLDNIGALTIFDYVNFPNEVFRIGTIYPTESSAIPDESYEFQKLIYEDMEKSYVQWGEMFTERFELWTAGKEALPNECSWFAYSKNSWLHHTRDNFGFGYGVDELIFIEDGIKGIADETLYYSWFPNIAISFSPSSYDGIILPESFENLTGNTILGNYQSELLVDIESEYIELEGEKTITFLNPKTKIFDSSNTIWEGFTICGYKNSTAHEYALKYSRKFVDISNCSHSETAEKFAYVATCENTGIAGSVHCQYCGELLKKGGYITPKTDHNFSVLLEHQPESCFNVGYKKYKCSECDTESTVYIERSEHKNEDGNNTCDNCWKDLTDDCSCNCHKGGIAGFFFKLINFLQKLFGKNKVCACGRVH